MGMLSRHPPLVTYYPRINNTFNLGSIELTQHFNGLWLSCQMVTPLSDGARRPCTLWLHIAYSRVSILRTCFPLGFPLGTPYGGSVSTPFRLTEVFDISYCHMPRFGLFKSTSSFVRLYIQYLNGT